MTQIGFIGLGNMGFPMVQNLIKAGHAVIGFDIQEPAREKFVAAGGNAATSLDAACMGAEVIITMLPAGKEVRDVYLGEGGILASAADGALLIDCSTIDIESARAVVRRSCECGSRRLDIYRRRQHRQFRAGETRA